MLRFAPSPTTDINIGDLHIALFNYLTAQHLKEDFIVRIEDLDSKDAKSEDILDTLALFNIHYTQVMQQSQNVRFHAAMALQLMHEKMAFSCFCSSAWLDSKKSEAEALSKEYCYDDACRNLPAELVIDNTNPFTVRITRPNAPLLLSDKLQGDLSFSPDYIDSFVIMHQDKTPTSDFASAVDDMLNDISVIIRDKTLIQHSAKQEHIRKSLSYDKKVTFIHIPTIKEKITVKSLLADGFLPEAILNYLISMSMKTDKEIFTLEECKKWFRIENIISTSTSASIQFDMQRLREINREHLKNLEPRELSRYVGFADDEIGKLAYIYLDDIATTKELKEKINPIFNQTAKITNDEGIETLITTIKNAPYFDEYEAFRSYIIEKSGFDGEKFEKQFRMLLTNSNKGPELSEIYKYLKNYIGEIIK